MLIHRFVLLGFSTLFGLMIAQQQPQYQTGPIVIKQLKDNVYLAQGGPAPAANSGVIIGNKGVIVVDTKGGADAGKEMLAAIGKLTAKPVTHVILTHSDGDHVNGLAAFPKGITIIAHENNKKEQEAALARGGRGAPPADSLPTQTLNKARENLTIDGVSFTLLHWDHAHTNGDLVVYLPNQKVAFTGDLVATVIPYMLIHLEKNGSYQGWVEAAKGMIALNADTYVTGHGDLQTKADIQKRMTESAQRYAKIKELIAQKKSISEIRQALGEPEPPAPAAGQRGGIPTFTQTTYEELTRKQ